jgi:hypothetical protein
MKASPDNSVQAAPAALAETATTVAFGQGRNGLRFDFNPHQGNIETYGMDKGKNGNPQRSAHGDGGELRGSTSSPSDIAGGERILTPPG